MNFRITALALAAQICVGLAPAAFGIHAGNGSIITVADNTGSGFSLQASIMALTGENHEYVYAGANDIGLPYDYKVSELIWDIDSLWMAGGVASLQIGNLIRINLGGWTGINKGSGSMDDYDWLEPSTSQWTDYSHSDVDIETAYSIDINVSYQFIDLGPCKLHAVIGFKEDYWEWSDYAGTYIYSSQNGFRDITGDFGGVNAIDYNQTFDIPYVGIKATLDKNRIHASAYLQYSTFVYANDEDHHILRDIYFNESFYNGNYFALGIDATLDITDAIFITCSLNLQSIPEFTGDMTMTDASTGQTISVSDAAGISSDLAAIAASLGWKF